MTDNLKKTLEKLNKQYGKNTVMRLGDTEPIKENLLSTGSLMIDKVLGGGIGCGRVTEIYGVESSGKSTLCLHIAAECQKNGGTVAYIDAENALDVDYAKKLGVDTDSLIFTQPTTAEDALDIADALAQSGDVQLIIIDSVAALCPKAELDGEMSDMTIGLLARLMSKALRKLTGTLNNKNCAVIFINQIREKVSTGFSMGPSETTTGGRALKFFASQRIELRKTTAIKSGNDVIGNNVKVKIVKNKIAPPMQVCEVPLVFGEGFAGANEVIDLGIQYEFIDKSGAWFTSHDGNRFQGKDKLTAYYNEHEDAYNDLRNKVKQAIAGLEIKQEYTIDPKTGEILDNAMDEDVNGLPPLTFDEANLTIE